MLRRRRFEAVDKRLLRLESRLDDTEDTVAATLGIDRIDDLAHRVELLAMSSVTHDDLLEVRMDAARLTAEVTRVRAELQSELDRLEALVDDLAEPTYPRRAAGWR